MGRWFRIFLLKYRASVLMRTAQLHLEMLRSDNPAKREHVWRRGGEAYIRSQVALSLRCAEEANRLRGC